MTQNINTYKFIVIEGLDGSGKTTISKEIAARLEQLGIKCFLTNEPDYTTETGQLIRRMLDEKRVTSNYGLQLLFSADRAFHVEKIKKELETRWVICDRYFFSTLAYILSSESGQEYFSVLKGVNDKFLQPDMTIFIDYPAKDCIEQMNKSRNGERDFFEQIEKLEKIRFGYIKLANEYDIQVVQRDQKTVKELSDEIMRMIKVHFKL